MDLLPPEHSRGGGRLLVLIDQRLPVARSEAVVVEDELRLGLHLDHLLVSHEQHLGHHLAAGL